MTMASSGSPSRSGTRQCRLAAGCGKRGGSLPAQRVLHAADGVADFPASLVGLPFAFELLVAAHLARDLLDLTLGLLSRTFDAILVHCMSPVVVSFRTALPRQGSRDTEPHCQTTAVTPIAIAAAAMTAVAIQPTRRSPSWTGNFPMTFVLAVMCIMATITGTATTPLITALQ